LTDVVKYDIVVIERYVAERFGVILDSRLQFDTCQHTFGYII